MGRYWGLIRDGRSTCKFLPTLASLQRSVHLLKVSYLKFGSRYPLSKLGQKATSLRFARRLIVIVSGSRVSIVSVKARLPLR